MSRVATRAWMHSSDAAHDRVKQLLDLSGHAIDIDWSATITGMKLRHS